MSEAKPILLFFIAFALCSPAFTAESEIAEPLRGAIPPAASLAPASVPSAPPSPALRETVAKDSAATSQDNSVESFFQIDSKKRNSAQSVLMQPATVSSSASNKSKSTFDSLGRCMWHVLDNLGVPMFFGQDAS